VAAQQVKLTQRIIEVNQLKTKSGVYIYEIFKSAEINNMEIKEGILL